MFVANKFEAPLSTRDPAITVYTRYQHGLYILNLLEHVANGDKPGVIRLERHMGGGEGNQAAPRVKYTVQALDEANLKWFKEAPECFDVGRGDYVQFNLVQGQVNGFLIASY